MSTAYQDCYDGSQIFLSLSHKIGLPIDLVNFLIAQVAALWLARLFRKPLKHASPEFRHSVCLLIGLLMGYFCFGKQAIHLSVLPMLCYTLLKTVPNHVMGNVILGVSMLYLSCLHLHRQIYHTADYTLDITGPLMVITQRVTSLAYSLQDSMAREVNGNKQEAAPGVEPARQSHGPPSPLQYFAYTLAFQTLMCGPVVFYSDYISFIEGARKQQEVESGSAEGAGGAGGAEPSPRLAVLCKLAGSGAAAALYLALASHYPVTALQELGSAGSSARQWSALYALWYAHAAALVVRCKYYHAWLLADAICNNSGMGFNGYDARGAPRWDRLSNVDVVAFELAQNFRSAVGAWNKNTNTWLRALAYARGAGGAAVRTARVYALSALWHGFHPGYYLTFCAGGLFTVAARKVRAAVRPRFLGGRAQKLCYDLLTLITTRVAMTYATVPFVVLHLAPSLAFYGKLYYSLHFIAMGALFIPAPKKGLAEGSSELPQPAPAAAGKESARETLHRNGKVKIS